jgi:outer membrane immunogenic protein
MLKQLLIASAVLATTASVAFAGHAYKGEYKGEAPCPTYQYTTGPYVGFSLGDRTNYNGSPSVFKGIDANLSLGYGMMMNPAFYLAGEVFGLYTINVKDFPSVTGTTTNSVKSTWGWGLSVIPGYMITDYVLAYVRLGGISTRFNNADVTRTGWQVGVGGQTNVYQNWDLRAEYVYTGYGRVNGAKTQSDVFNVGLVYKFV